MMHAITWTYSAVYRKRVWCGPRMPLMIAGQLIVIVNHFPRRTTMRRLFEKHKAGVLRE
jgi:hypothetical protein